MANESIFVHELKRPFSYTPANKGDLVEAQFIELHEPSAIHIKHCSPLKQCFMRAVSRESSEHSGAESVEVDGESESFADKLPMEVRVMNSIYSSGEDMGNILLSAKELFREVALVDGDKKMTVPMLDAMSIDDIEAMTGKYMVNFILASVLAEE